MKNTEINTAIRDAAERVGGILIPEGEYGPGMRWNKMFSLNSSVGDDAVEAIKLGIKPILDDRNKCLEWLDAIQKDPSLGESLKYGLREFLSERTNPQTAEMI